MDPCISVVEGLSQREKNSILAVLQRDEKLRVGQEHKITELKHEINTIRMCSVMRAGDNHGKMCLRCRSELGMIFNRGDLCPACRFKVCKQCQEVMFNGSWLCILCYKQRQLKWLSGEWAASFEQNPLRKWASGSDLKQGSLQLMPGTTKINIDDSPPRQATNNKSRKIARNGVSKHDDQKSKVEVPKEGDQVKLLELFNVLRVKKPQEEASAEMQVKHIKTRGYSDSDSDSSSNSDSEVRSSSTALSMTESEIDTHRVDSPIMEEVAQVGRLESSSQRRESSRDLDSPRRLTPHNVDKMETRSSKQVTNLESQNPAHSKHSSNSAMDQKGRSLGRAQSQGGQSKRPSLDAEAQSSMNRPGDDVSFEGSSEHSGEADSLSLHSNLNEHVRKTREVLGEKHAQSQVQKVNSSIAHDHEMAARPKIRQQLVTGAEHSRKSSKQGAEANIRPSADEREMKDNEMHPYKKPVKVHVTSDSDTSSISSKSKLRASFDEDTESVGNMSVPRAGSPYSFSMESLPSSNPSPTMQRRAHHSGSLQDSSDNDSVSRGSESSSQGRHTPRKQGSEEEFVVEELSKVRFRRVANTLEKMALMTNMKKSPNRNINDVVGLGKTQDRDGVEGGGACEHDSVAMQQGGKYLLCDSGMIIESPDITFDKLDAEGKHVKKGCVEEIHISARPESSPEVIEKVTVQVSNQSIMSEVWNKLEGSNTNRNLLHGDWAMKTEADLSWFDDVTLNHNNVIRRQSQLKPIPRYFTSSLVESERYPSEADSIEGMIDNMSKAPLLAEPSRQELRSTLTNSESTLPDTPMSLFPEELCDRRSANYRLAYISDDNLDDDDDANEVFQEEKDEILTGVLSPERKTLKAMGSLDLLLDQQGDLIGGEDEANTEIELEYQSALRYSQGENGENSSSDFEDDTFSKIVELDRPLLVPKEEAEEISERNIVESKAGNMLVSQASLDILIDNQGSFIDNENKKKPKGKPLLVSKEETAEISKKHVVESKAGQRFVTQSSLDILIDKQGSFIDTEYKKKPKAKLSAQSSLDVLIEKQGKYIDFDADSAELDPDFLDSIRQQFDERIIASKAMDKKQTKDYVYLGVPHATSHNANETGQLVDNGNEGNASEVAASRKAEENEANQISTKAMFLDARTNDSDSSDSDMLSIIEEADVEHELNDNADEVSEHITEDKCVHIPKEAVHIETLAHHENTTLYEEKSNEEPIIEKHVHVKPQTVPMLQKTIIHEEAAHFEALVHHENTTFNKEKSNVEPIVEKHVHVKPQSVPMFQKTIIHEAANFEALAHHENTPQNVEKFTVEPILEKHVNVKPQTVPMLQKTINEAVPPPKPPRAKHNTLHDAILKQSYTEKVPITDCETKDLEIDKKKQKYKKIHEHWLAVEKQEHDDFVPDDTDTASVAHAIDETVESEQKVELETSNNQTTSHTITNGALPFTKPEADEKNAGHQGIRFQGVCHSISDNEAELQTQRKEKRMTITSDDSCYSIEDADYVCKENVSDEEVFTNLGHLEAGQVDARVSEEKQPVDYHVHEAVEACHSIADAVPSKSKESTKDSYGVIPEETADDSKTVGLSHSPLKRLSGEKADPAFYVSKGVFKTEVDLILDESGHVSPPFVSDTEFFKVPPPPERPARRKKSSTATSPKSTDYDSLKAFDTEELITEENPATRVESPQSVSENSSIHEDSGHGSGASQVTTPEHKRTDSSFSQSSIPSTHSTVTDEDEDIDSVVARVQRKQQMMQSNRGNLLSVFGDSRESIASYYSDAGDVSYSKIPVTGEILFSISYNYKTGMLEVGIKNCKDIAVVDAKRNRSDPYVKSYLLPDRTRGGKRKTKVKKSTINPQFDETLRYSISKSELENRTLWVTVWHNDRFGRNVFLGEVTINFDYYKFDDPSPRWYPLQERMDYQPAAMMVYKGDLSISLRYVTAEHSSKLSGKKEVKSGVKGQGQLEVTVKEARNLTGVKSNGFSDPFCKGYLLPERNKGSKQKTKVIRKDCNPCWNHTFIFEDISLAELKERCLELTVWDYEKLSSNDFLGGARLNLGSGESQGHQVDWMDARGEEMSMWQAMLDRPNLWIDGVLILRANMDKRKY